MVRHRLRCALLAGSALSLAASPVMAEDMTERLRRIEAQLSAQAERLGAQEQRLNAQQQVIEDQELALRTLRAQRDSVLAELRAGRSAPAPQIQLAQVEPIPSGPVGQAPEPPSAERRVREVTALPENVGILTRPGQLILEPSVEYSNTSSNRLVFRGIEVVSGINFGLIEADDADRSSITGALGARFGLTNRIEVEARLPYVYREDRVETVKTATANTNIDAGDELRGYDLGDLELAARYQINSGARGWPIFVANARMKPPTGTGPYDVEFDDAGAAETLATGSGFWGVEGGLTMLYPTDPAVIFAGLSYLSNLPRDVDKVIGDRLIGRVDPGDSIGASLGFGLALNPRFSVSFGYSHNYIFQTDTEVSSADAPTPTLVSASGFHVGSMQMGWSYRLSDRLTLSNNFEFGVTSEAPDLRVVFRAPYRF